MAHPVTVTTSGERAITVTRVFAAPRSLVFDRWTKPEWLARWLTGPEGWAFVVCDMDLREGGAYRWVWRGPDGTEMGMGGVFREIVRPERIVATEVWDQEWPGGKEDVATTSFTEHDGQTTVTTTISFTSPHARDGALASDMTQGMAESYERLDAVLASRG